MVWCSRKTEDWGQQGQQVEMEVWSRCVCISYDEARLPASMFNQTLQHRRTQKHSFTAASLQFTGMSLTGCCQKGQVKHVIREEKSSLAEVDLQLPCSCDPPVSQHPLLQRPPEL
ncbi:hypothetical protein F2P79_001876 [Pimephales promelas]|nr:hypothetical protein F2P79_001876 [Pimephales promelas]